MTAKVQKINKKYVFLRLYFFLLAFFFINFVNVILCAKCDRGRFRPLLGHFCEKGRDEQNRCKKKKEVKITYKING